MTVLELDPPHQLRLVSSTGDRPVRNHRYRSGAQLGRAARDLYRGVLQAALESGTPVVADALRVVLTTKQSSHAGSIRHFTATDVWQLMFVDVVSWCRARHVGVPAGSVDALRATIDYLGATDSLAPGSDALARLHAALDECTGGWTETDDHPASGRRRGSVRSHRGPKHT